ncbi:hypothetical protein [Streptomyces chartreusis]|uniref:hypothetical protein n=1 Tax=Streptomyces chartreusis TaxID=1969 RepID=UPI003649DE8F
MPTRLTPHQHTAWTDRTELPDEARDQRIIHALTAASGDGKVIQRLTGGPELVDAYETDGHFTPVEHALLSAALDIRRLGHTPAMSANLLAAAADGYLQPWERPGNADWATTALTGLTAGTRPDGTRTDIRHTLAALTAVRSHTGEPDAHYTPADYLEQHTRLTRREHLGPGQLWQALADHVPHGDTLLELGHAARGRLLHRHAARLFKRCAEHGDPYAIPRLLHQLQHHADGITGTAAQWALQHTPTPVCASLAATLVQQLHTSGHHDPARTLALRTAQTTPLDDAPDVLLLLAAVRKLGLKEAERVLTRRALAADPDWPATLTDGLVTAVVGMPADEAFFDALSLIRSLQEALPDTVKEAVRQLVARADLNDAKDGALILSLLGQVEDRQAQAAWADRLMQLCPLRPPLELAILIDALDRYRMTDSAHAFAEQAALHARLDDPDQTAGLLATLHQGRHSHAAGLLADRISEELPSHPLLAAAPLLEELIRTGHPQAATALLRRLTTDFPSPPDPAATATAVRTLIELDEHALAGRLAEHAAHTTPSTSLDAVAALLPTLHRHAPHAEVLLLGPDVAHKAPLNDPAPTARLLSALDRTGNSSALDVLLSRSPAEHADLDNAHGTVTLLRVLHTVDAEQEQILRHRILTRPEVPDLLVTDQLLTHLQTVGDTGGQSALARRIADAGWATSPFLALSGHTQPDLHHGREPDATPSGPWGFDDLS